MSTILKLKLNHLLIDQELPTKNFDLLEVLLSFQILKRLSKITLVF